MVAPFSHKSDWPFYWVTRVNALYINELEKALKPSGLDIPRWRVLSSLRDHGTLSVSVIAEYCILKLNTTTKIVQRMVVDGLVVSQCSALDRRVTEVMLTPAGKDAAAHATELAQAIYNKTFSDFDPDEIAQINRLLRRVFDKLGHA